VNVIVQSLSATGTLRILRKAGAGRRRSLTKTQLTDEGLVILEGVTKFEVLYLDKTKITSADLAMLALRLDLYRFLISNDLLRTAKGTGSED